MKRKSKIIAIVFALFCFVMCLCSCSSDEDPVKKVELLENYNPDVYAGNFNPSDYTLRLTRSSGESEDVAVTMDMIPMVDRFKLYNVGKQEITVEYLNLEFTLKLNIMRNVFDVSMESKVVTYTGSPVSLNIEGYYPEGTTIEYPNGEEFTNVGTYSVVAILSHKNYESKKLEAKLQIVCADYSLDSISFKDDEVEYDENAHEIGITGDLPTDLSVSYTIRKSSAAVGTEAAGNSATDIGEYTVTAVFASTNINYNLPEPITATLTIDPAKYYLDTLYVNNPELEYEEGESYEFTISNKLPTWLSVKYENYVDKDDCTYEASTGYYYYYVKDSSGDFDLSSDGMTFIPNSNGNYVRCEIADNAIVTYAMDNTNNDITYAKDENGTYLKVLLAKYIRKEIGYSEMVCDFTVSNTNYVLIAPVTDTETEEETDSTSREYIIDNTTYRETDKITIEICIYESQEV